MSTSSVPFVAFAAHEGPSVTVGGNHIKFRVGRNDSQGDLMIAEYTAPPHFPGPAPHIHQHTDEAFHVLNGVLQVTVGSESLRLGAGGMVMVPRGVPHTFANPSDTPVTMLIIMTPGGFEGYFREMAALVESGKVANPDAVAALQSRYDLVAVPDTGAAMAH